MSRKPEKVKIVMEMGRTCPRGQIRRKGYTTKKGVHVGPTCVKDVGERGKTPKAGVFIKIKDPGGLHGWKHTQSASERHKALRRSLKTANCRKVIQRLTAVKVFTKTTDPESSRKANQDMAWLRKQKACKLKTK